MNKADKRQRSIRNKLMAAVAMLLVASIMTVTTTYAWFTLSTAPEVQGITTTVGANGNLEIALSPLSGDYNEIASTVGDGAIQDWTVKNLTWGNLLDLSDESYALDKIVLLPSRLNITEGTGTSAATLAGSPLKIPVYGSDGRISQLDGTKVVYGARDSVLDSFVAMMTAAAKGYGVRALGTSSSRSDTEVNFQNALANLETNRTTAKNTVTNALNTYGNALAEVALLHAGGDPDEGYGAYVDELAGIMDELSAASAAVEEGLYNALLALASSNIKTSTDGDLFADTTVEGKKLYQYMKDNKDAGIPLATVWDAMFDTSKSNVGALLNTAFPELVEAYDTWKETDAAVEETASNVDALAEQTDGVTWTELRVALDGLMNPDKLTINGKSIDEAKENAGSLMNGSGISLEMHDGSGVIANFGKLTGNISSQVILGDVKLNGVGLKDARINLVTTSQPAEGALMTQVRVVIAATGPAEETPAEGEDTVAKKNVLDVTYGYVLDFVFRTNAANSSLLLQTEGAQRIYEDSQNAATMGNGSTMTFDGTYANLDSLVSMMSGIRVVFTNTRGTSNEVYGIAKIKFDEAPFIMALDGFTYEATENTNAEAGDPAYILTQNSGDVTEAENTNIYLTATEDSKGNITTGLKLGDHQYLTNVEPVYDVNGNITHYIWTVKTAKWYEKKVVTTDTDGTTVLSEVTTYENVKDADGKIVYFEDEQIFDANATGGWVTNPDFNAAYPTDLVSTTVPNDDGSKVITTIRYGGYSKDTDAPQYYVVKDQAVQLEGELYLHNYEVAPDKITETDDAGNKTEVANPNAGMLTFGEVKSVQTLTTLDQNVPTGVTALVYLDGDYIDNSDVTNSSNGISNTGVLNLQFASSATLVPMQNTELSEGAEYKATFNNTSGEGLYYLSGLSAGEIDTSKEIKVNSGVDYTFLMLNNTAAVTYKAGEQGAVVPLEGVLTQVSLAGVTGRVYAYTIPGEDITDDLTITVTAAATGG